MDGEESPEVRGSFEDVSITPESTIPSSSTSSEEITEWVRPPIGMPSIAESDFEMETPPSNIDSLLTLINDPESPSIFDLPLQIRKKIYGFLPDLNKLRLSCRTINNEIESGIPLSIGLYERAVRNGVLDFTRRILVGRLAIGYLPMVRLPEDFLKSPQHLSELSIFGVTAAQNVQLLLRICRHISKLSIDFGAIDKVFIFDEAELDSLSGLISLDICARSILAPRNPYNFFRNIQSILRISKGSLRTISADLNTRAQDLSGFVLEFLQCISSNLGSLRKLELYLGDTGEESLPQRLGSQPNARELLLNIQRDLGQGLLKLKNLSLAIEGGVGLTQWGFLLDRAQNLITLTMDMGSAAPEPEFYRDVVLHSSETLVEITLENLLTRPDHHSPIDMQMFGECLRLKKLSLSQWASVGGEIPLFRGGRRGGRQGLLWMVPMVDPEPEERALELGPNQEEIEPHSDVLNLAQLPLSLEHLSLSKLLVDTESIQTLLSTHIQTLKVLRLGFYRVQMPSNGTWGLPLPLMREIALGQEYSSLKELYLSNNQVGEWCSEDLKAFISTLNAKPSLEERRTRRMKVRANHHNANRGCFVMILKEEVDPDEEELQEVVQEDDGDDMWEDLSEMDLVD